MSTLKVNTIQNASGDAAFDLSTAGAVKVPSGTNLWAGALYNTSGGLVANLVDGHLELGPGTTTSPPIDFDQTGVLLTTPIIGGLEFDGTAFYATVVGPNRGVIASEHIIALTSTNTLTSQTAAQPLFDGGGGPTNGAITLGVGTYEFECVFALASMATGANGAFGFALGGTATKTEAWMASATKSAFATASAPLVTWNTAANTAITASNTTATGHALIKGVIRVTVAGTIIPQVSLGQAAAAVVQANSYFKCKVAGGSSFVSVGAWS